MSLQAAIAAWDCKSRADILAVHQEYSARPGYVTDLIRIAQNPDHADGATWLIKHAFEQGFSIADPIGVIRAGARAHSWPAQLHVLQLLPHLGVPVGAAGYTETLVDAATGSPRTMLRAWGYAGCDILGNSVERLRPKMAAILVQARATESSGSVLARLKRCNL